MAEGGEEEEDLSSPSLALDIATQAGGGCLIDGCLGFPALAVLALLGFGVWAMA